MKSNAIVRIVIWSVVILVLLAVLIAGLANNLFTVFRDNTDVIHHDSLEVSQSVLVMSETNIYEMPNDQSKVKGTLAAGDAVVIGRSEVFNEENWAYITSPDTGWIPAECVAQDTVNRTGSTGSASVDTVREINIEWISGSVTVEPGDVQEITFSESGAATDQYKMVWKQSDDKLTIQFCKDSNVVGFGLHFGDGSKDLTITVPRGWVCDSLELDTASTDLTVRDMIIREVEIDSASGTAKFENCTISSLDVDTASGDVTFTGSLSELDFDAASASFTGVLENVPDRVKMDSMSGDLALTLPEDAGFTVSLDAMSSDFSSDFPTVKKNKSYVCGDGHCKIDVSAMNGDVAILKSVKTAAAEPCTIPGCTDPAHDHNTDNTLCTTPGCTDPTHDHHTDNTLCITPDCTDPTHDHHTDADHHEENHK